MLSFDNWNALSAHTETMHGRIRFHMEHGVRFTDLSAQIAEDVVIGAGTVILPGVILQSGTVIGKNCTIGPNTLIVESTIGDSATVNQSQIMNSIIGDGTSIRKWGQTAVWAISWK